jgi:hypothetical protein
MVFIKKIAINTINTLRFHIKLLKKIKSKTNQLR